MQDGHPSETANGAAVLRAVHQLLDDEPKLLHDPIVPRLLDESVLDRIRTDPSPFQIPQLHALRAHVVLRSRYAEDRLEAAVRHGVRQYVVLGAGFDTFAYRQPVWAHALRVFEVDHPDSQAWKRGRLRRAGIRVPANVTYAPIDFERETLGDALAAAGLDARAPVFCSWLGVTVYLTPGAIAATLRAVASYPRGSELVLTFAGPAAPGRPAAASMLETAAAALGEPWRTRLTPEEMLRMLTDAGFSRAKVVDPAALAAEYFAGRRDLPAPRRARIAHASIGGELG